MKRIIDSSAIEYQGISIVKKDIPKIEKIMNKYHPGLKLRPNLHICLDYFGVRKQSDTHIEKTQNIFPFKTMGKQIDIYIVGIGYYKRINENGEKELMNVSLLIDDSTFDEITIEDKTLTAYNKKGMPWITLYTNPKTVEMNGKEYPVSTAKHSGKCFGLEELAENEVYDMEILDNPITVTGELCVFRGGLKFFHVKDNTTRLITWKSLREEQQMALEAEFPKPEKKEVRPLNAEEYHKKLLND